MVEAVQEVKHSNHKTSVEVVVGEHLVKNPALAKEFHRLLVMRGPLVRVNCGVLHPQETHFGVVQASIVPISNAPPQVPLTRICQVTSWEVSPCKGETPFLRSSCE